MVNDTNEAVYNFGLKVQHLVHETKAVFYFRSFSKGNLLPAKTTSSTLSRGITPAHRRSNTTPSTILSRSSSESTPSGGTNRWVQNLAETLKFQVWCRSSSSLEWLFFLWVWLTFFEIIVRWTSTWLEGNNWSWNRGWKNTRNTGRYTPDIRFCYINIRAPVYCNINSNANNATIFEPNTYTSFSAILQVS